MTQQCDIDHWSESSLKRNRGWLIAYLTAATGDPHAADDLVQDVFVVAYEKKATFSEGGNFGGWLRNIAKNCLHRHFRERKKRPLLSLQALEILNATAEAAEAELMEQELHEKRVSALQQCLKALNHRGRTIFQYRYENEMSIRLVAEKLGMKESFVNVIAFRTRKALMKCMQKRISP